MAFFPPTLAQQIEIGEHITVAFTAVREKAIHCVIAAEELIS